MPTSKSLKQSNVLSQKFAKPSKPASQSHTQESHPITIEVEEATKHKGCSNPIQSTSTIQKAITTTTTTTKPPSSGTEQTQEGRRRKMETGKRQINRGDPELSYAYGAKSEKRKRSSVFDHSANTSTETSPNLNGEQDDHDGESMEMSEPPATPEPQDRYAILKRRKLEAQRKLGEDLPQEHSRIQIKSPRKGAQTVKRVDVVVTDSPGRSKRASTIKKSIQSPKSKAMIQHEVDAPSPPISTHDANSEGGRSSSARHSQNLYDASNTRSLMHGKINSFYMDRDPDSIEEVEENEVNELAPSSLLLGTQRQSRDIIGSQPGLNSIHSSDLYDSRQLDYAHLQKEADALAGAEESSVSGSVIDQSNSSLRKNGGFFQGKGNHTNAKFASIEEEPISGDEQSAPENSKHSHTPMRRKTSKVQRAAPLHDRKPAVQLASQAKKTAAIGPLNVLLLCAAILGAIFAILLTTQHDLAKQFSPFPSNTTLGDELLKHRIESMEKRLKQSEKRLKQSEKEAAKFDQRIVDAKSIADMVKDSTKSLPEMMQLLQDKQKGQLKLDDQTLETLRQLFVEKGKENPKQASAASLSWDTFQKANDKALRQYAKDAITGEINSGNSIISRTQFIDLLKQELKQETEKMKVDMEAKFNENAREMQIEILAKVREQREMFERSGSWKKMTGSSSGNLPANLDSAKSSIIELIEDALETYSADRIGERDYALYSAGGRIIPSFTSPTFGLRKRTSAPLAWLSRAPTFERFGAEGQPPVIALVPDVSPGMCWAFPGTEGTLGISLARRVRVSKITLEHLPPSISFDQSISAPRDVTVWGIVERPIDAKRLAEYRRKSNQLDKEEEEEAEGNAISPAPIPPSDRHLLLSSFTYDVSTSKSIQSFPVSREAEQLDIPIASVQVQIHSNHGKKDYTCVYRVRVHGQEWTLDDELQSQQ